MLETQDVKISPVRSTDVHRIINPMRALPITAAFAARCDGLELENFQNFTDQEIHKGPHGREQSVSGRH